MIQPEPLPPGEIHLYLARFAPLPRGLVGRDPAAVSAEAPARRDDFGLPTAPELRDEALLRRYRALLNPEEERRYQRFLVAGAKHEFLLARALVRTALSRYADVAPTAWTFAHNDYGRPELAGPGGAPPLRFNISHTRGLVVCAVTLERELGVDVEYTRRRTETVAIADRFFAPDEVAELHTRPAGEQHQRFFDYWTLKESYIKARGMGLALPLGQFAFSVPADPGAGEVKVTIDPELQDRAERWRFWLFSPTAEHRAALCVEREEGTLGLTLRRFAAVPLARPPRELP